MSLDQLDAFLAQVRLQPALASRLSDPADPMDLESFLALAREQGFQVEEADVLAAQVRAEANLSDEDLQGGGAPAAPFHPGVRPLPCSL
jgi:predicted ribosomally synthesized peptide with nif11-like leader